MKELKFYEKRTLAQYLIDDWSFDKSKEKKALLQAAIDAACEADAKGEKVQWKNTPSWEAIDILRAKKENPMLKTLKKVYGKHGANALLALSEGKETPVVYAMSQKYNYFEENIVRGLKDAGIPRESIVESNISPRKGQLGRRWSLKGQEDIATLKGYLEKLCREEEQ